MNHPQTNVLPNEEWDSYPKDEAGCSEKTAYEAPPKLKAIDRKQMVFRSVEIEKLIPPDHEARAIWEFVGRLDLNCYFDDIRSKEGCAGRSSLDPQLMISLWIYSYSKGVNSGREMAQLCEFDPAYQWLTGMTSINHHSLSDFRVDHKLALDNLLVEVLALLSAENLITMERDMHDGTKIKANASGKSFRREKTLLEHLKLAQEHVAAVDELQATEEGSLRQKKAQERAARDRKERLEKSLSELKDLRSIKKSEEEREAARISMTDPECRNMKQGNGGFAPSYNVQISTDAANDLIVGVGVSQAGNDTHELIPSIGRIEKGTGQTPKQMVVDGGFTTKANILEMSQRSIDLIGSIPENLGSDNLENRGGDSHFNSQAFAYNSKDDFFTCPAGQIMRLKEKNQGIGSIDCRYLAERGICQKCQFQQKCCPQNSRKGRSIRRTIYASEIVAFQQKMETEEAKAIYKQRPQTAEFPNAWIKDKIGLRQFRLRGLIKVGMEALWACITYNIKRWIGLKWRLQWEINEG